MTRWPSRRKPAINNCPPKPTVSERIEPSALRCRMCAAQQSRRCSMPTALPLSPKPCRASTRHWRGCRAGRVGTASNPTNDRTHFRRDYSRFASQKVPASQDCRHSLGFRRCDEKSGAQRFRRSNDVIAELPTEVARLCLTTTCPLPKFCDVFATLGENRHTVE